jgi:hypothetical protein
MIHERQSFNLVLLPDGRLLAIGGESCTADTGCPVLQAEWLVSCTVLLLPSMAIAQQSQLGQFVDPPDGPVWPLNPMRAVHLPTGKILVWRDPETDAKLWDPVDGSFEDRPSFPLHFQCSGHAALATGAFLVAGGTSGHEDDGPVADAAHFETAGGGTWTQVQSMLNPRFYPTCTSLPDGRVLVTAGSAMGGSQLYPEVYDPNDTVIEGNAALVGDFTDNEAGPGHGAAYLFRLLEKEGWIQEEKLLPSAGPWTALFGWSVALGGDLALVGAHGENFQSGAAYAFLGASGIDCNANDRSDSCDIFFGASDDTDGNGVPDDCGCRWDVDGGGTVGITDLLSLLAAWGTDPGGPPDFDGDGSVGITDLLGLLAHWGSCP